MLVALFGVVSAVFGPLLVERLRSKAVRKDREVALEAELRSTQIDRVAALSQELIKLAAHEEWKYVVSANQAASSLIAVVGVDGEEVAVFVRDLVEKVRVETNSIDALSSATTGIDRLFAWLRGDKDKPNMWDAALF